MRSTIPQVTADASVRDRACPLCQAPAGQPCQPKPAGDHLARYLDAYTAGQLTRSYMAVVLGELIVVDTCTVIAESAAPKPPGFDCDCGRRLPWPSRVQDETCPDCGTVWEHDGVSIGGGARIKQQPSCHYCGRTGQPLRPCCERHPDDLVCADVAACRDFLLTELKAQGARSEAPRPEPHAPGRDPEDIPEPVAALLAAGRTLTYEPEATGGWFAILRDADGRLAENGNGPDKADALAHLAQRIERRGELPAAAPSRDELLDALRAVREAIAIPYPATVGDGEKYAEILQMRVMHAKVTLDALLAAGRPSYADAARDVAYLRERLAECPAEGYKTWDERVAEMEAARKNGGAR